MLNGKRYTESERGRARVEQMAQVYSKARDQVGHRITRVNGWIARKTQGGHRALLLVGVATLFLGLAGVGVVLFYSVSFTSAAPPAPTMHQVEHIGHIQEQIMEEARKAHQQRQRSAPPLILPDSIQYNPLNP